MSENENLPAVQPAQTRAAVTLGAKGLTPQDLDGLWRVAQYVSRSGLAPKGVQTPEAVFVAMEMGLELGLPLMASLQNIAVVNGRPTLWGDSQLAVVRSTGELEEFSEWYEQGGKRLARNPITYTDDTAAVCRVKRRGLEAQETAFSVGDAKRADLWGKQGPWTQYPGRMLRFRARSFALRDQFGDALRGLMSTEEAADAPLVNVTPPAVRPIFATRAVAPEPVAVEEHPAPEPEMTPVSEPAQEPLQPEQIQRQRLAALVVGAGFDFDGFAKFLDHHKFDTGDGTGFDGLTEATVARLLKSPDAMLKKLREFHATATA